MASVPQSPFGGALKFKRPTARGRASANNLRQSAVNDENADMHRNVFDGTKMQAASSKPTRNYEAEMTGSADTEVGASKTLSSRTASPAPSALSAGETSQRLVSKVPATLEDASARLAQFMDEAHSGSFAVGALGQKLLDQQAQIKALLARLDSTRFEHSTEVTQDSSRQLIEQTQAQVMQMKEEQQKLVVDLLHANNVDVAALLTSATHIDTQTLVTSFGMPMPDASAAREARRQKNAAAPNLSKDETLINDIQQQLIHEIRRLQALVAERDKALATMSEALDEAARIKALHEASIKKLETEKDTQDANLYELEAKEAILREEHEGVAKSLKKLENEMRILKRQLAEKADAAESFKASNEDLEEKLEDARSNVATLKAKSVADQKTINGLKSQVNDYEVKARQALEKIPASHSGWSQSLGHDNIGDLSMTSAASRDVQDSLEGNGRSAVRAHAQALTPSASVDDALVNRLRPSDKVKALEEDIAKWKAAAFKYRKKWNETRQKGSQTQTPQERDDSTDDDDEDMWADEPAAPSRALSTRSRLTSGASRRGKTMGDAFGLLDKRASWHSHNSLSTDRHTYDDEDDSQNADSVRGSIDGFDPTFADPTLRGGRPNKRSKRWSGISATGGSAKASPLARQLELEDGNEVQDQSFASSAQPSTVGHATGALGDELGAFQRSQADADAVEAAEQKAAELEQAIADCETEHTEQIEALKAEHRDIIAQHTAIHSRALAELENRHAQTLQARDSGHEEGITALRREVAERIVDLNATHAQAMETLQQKHTKALAGRDAEHELYIAELEGKLVEKHNSTAAKQTQIHEQLMTDARQRHAEALTKQREDTESALVAMQREHKKAIEERNAMHASALAVKESEHGRFTLQNKREHERVRDELRSALEADLQQQEAAFRQMIAKKDAVIARKDEEIRHLHARLDMLEESLRAAESAARSADDKLQSTNERLATLEAAAKNLPPSDTQVMSDVFQDASENANTSVQEAKVEMRESSSQTDGLASDITMSEVFMAPLPSPREEERTADGTWLAKSSTIRRNRPSNEVPKSEIVMLPAHPANDAAATASTEMPPPEVPRRTKTNVPSRPTSPVPSDLLARANKGRSLDLQRSHSSRGGPPPSSYVAPNISQDSAASRYDYDRSSISSRLGHAGPRAPSALSMRSDAGTDFLSGRSDVTSALDEDERQQQALAASQRYNDLPTSTDPVVLGAVTSTMIGTYMYKYTRRGMGRTNIRHRRYFWVHPYTRTLYWTEQAPSEAVSSEAINKSAFIQDVLVVDDDNSNPPGLYHFSIVVQSLSRDVKFTAASKEQHDMWITALGYLVNRELPSDAAPNRAEPSDWRQSMRGKQAMLRAASRQSLGPRKSKGLAISSSTGDRSTVTPRKSFASLSGRARSRASDVYADAETTPRAQGQNAASQTPSLLHRRDTAAREYMEHWELLNKQGSVDQKGSESTPRAGASSRMSRRSAQALSAARDTTGGAASSMSRRTTASTQQRDPRAMTAEEMLAEDEARMGYDGLDNVRACCNGKHDVGSLAHRRHLQHQDAAHRADTNGVKTRKSQGAMSTMARPSTRSSRYTTAVDGDDGLRSRSHTSTRRPQTSMSHLRPLDANAIAQKTSEAATTDESMERLAGGLTQDDTVKANLSNLEKAAPVELPRKRSVSSTSNDAREFGSFGRKSESGTNAAAVEEAEKARLAAATPSSLSSTPTASGRTSALGRRFDKVMQIRRTRQSTSIR